MKTKIKSKKTGVTLIEAMAVLSIGALATTTILKIVEAADQRLTIDRYGSDKWPAIKSYNTREQVSEFISKEFIAFDANGCGLVDGWKP